MSCDRTRHSTWRRARGTRRTSRHPAATISATLPRVSAAPTGAGSEPSARRASAHTAFSATPASNARPPNVRSSVGASHAHLPRVGGAAGSPSGLRGLVVMRTAASYRIQGARNEEPGGNRISRPGGPAVARTDERERRSYSRWRRALSRWRRALSRRRRALSRRRLAVAPGGVVVARGFSPAYTPPATPGTPRSPPRPESPAPPAHRRDGAA